MHERIESVVPLLRPGLKLPVYRHHLKRLLGYYRPLERQLTRWCGEWTLHDFDFTGRLKSPLIAQDLLALGLSSSEIASAPDSAALPRTDTLAALS